MGRVLGIAAAIGALLVVGSAVLGTSRVAAPMLITGAVVLTVVVFAIFVLARRDRRRG
jgi:hypothetical protein